VFVHAGWNFFIIEHGAGGEEPDYNDVDELDIFMDFCSKFNSYWVGKE
jgi:hypothetical protein